MKAASQIFFILTLMQILYYIKNRNLGCLVIYGITYLVASKYSKKILHILLISSLMSLIVFDCGYTLEGNTSMSITNALCPNNLIPGNLKTKTLDTLKKHKFQCTNHKKTLENNIAITAMNPQEKKEKEDEVKELEKKIKYINKEIFNKEQQKKQ
jgi:hypothetical protein